MAKIYLLTGPINSGKSTRLLNWASKQKSITGIICLRENGKRILYSIYSKSYHEFETDDCQEKVLKIGRYKFLQKSFLWGEQELTNSIGARSQWIVIDEIGPLELQGKGFFRITKRLISDEELKDSNLLLVVREQLVDEVICCFNFGNDNFQFVDFI
jgi:nucleoside-triphosphatase THEP1